MFNTFGLGAFGYSLSQTLPWILWAFLCRFYINKYFGIKSQKTIILHIIFALLSFSFGYFINISINPYISSNLIIQIIISTIISLGTFFGLLFLFKELKKEDIIFFKQLFNMSTYVDSLVKEFQE